MAAMLYYALLCSVHVSFFPFHPYCMHTCTLACIHKIFSFFFHFEEGESFWCVYETSNYDGKKIHFIVNLQPLQLSTVVLQMAAIKGFFSNLIFLFFFNVNLTGNVGHCHDDDYEYDDYCNEVYRKHHQFVVFQARNNIRTNVPFFVLYIFECIYFLFCSFILSVLEV